MQADLETQRANFLQLCEQLATANSEKRQLIERGDQIQADAKLAQLQGAAGDLQPEAGEIGALEKKIGSYEQSNHHLLSYVREKSAESDFSRERDVVMGRMEEINRILIANVAQAGVR